MDIQKITTITSRSSKLSLLALMELWEAREMIVLWVLRDIKIRYYQSTLGIGWAVFPMLSQVLIYTLVFGKLVRIDSDGAPYSLFALAGVVPWIFFSQALNNVSSSVYGAGPFLHKIYFPRLILPIAALLDKFFDFLVSFFLLIVILLIYGVGINFSWFALPFLILVMIMAALGFGMLAAALAVHFRDILHLMGYVTTALMYASPVVYPVSLIPDRYKFIYGLNPMVGVIEGFRSALLSTKLMPWDLILESFCISLIALASGVAYFKHSESKFADVG